MFRQCHVENGNSFNPVARTTTNTDGTSTSTIPGPVTTEEKVQKKNDVKTRNCEQKFKRIVTSNKFALGILSFVTILASNYEVITAKRSRNQESRARNQDSSRRTVNVEDISSKAMVAIDGAGFDWSYMADEEVPSKLVLWLSQLQIKGVGYNDVPPPPTGLFAPPTIDLSNSGLKEFQQPECEGYGFKTNKGVYENSSNEIKKTTDAPIIEDWVSDCDEDESEVRILKYDNVQQKPNQANQPRKVSENPRRNFVPTAVLTESGVVSVSAARPINIVAPKSFVNATKTRPNAFQKSHSPSRRPFYQQTALKNRNLNDKVNTAKVNSVNSAKGNRVTGAVGEQGINAVKSSACCVWRPKIKANSSLELKGYLINNGYANLEKMLYDWS
ncbi:hypothetical protein Tco_0707840 [Tanacetum coccineum]